MQVLIRIEFASAEFIEGFILHDKVDTRMRRYFTFKSSISSYSLSKLSEMNLEYPVRVVWISEGCSFGVSGCSGELPPDSASSDILGC